MNRSELMRVFGAHQEKQRISMPLTVGFGRIGCAVALAAMLLARPGFAAGDADNGGRLAAHVIRPTQYRVSTDAAPPFATIAAGPDFDAGKIALIDPHPRMPNMSLTRAEAAD